MIELVCAIDAVASGRCGRINIPGEWTVYRDGDDVRVMVHPADGAVVCKMKGDGDEVATD